MSKDPMRTKYPKHLRPAVKSHCQQYYVWHGLLLRYDRHRCCHQRRTMQEYDDPTRVGVKYTSPECCSSMPYTYWYIALEQI